MKLVAAWRFLTVIPLPWLRQTRPEEAGAALGFFPLVGLALGLVLVLLDKLLSLALPAAVVNALLLAALVALSGGLHLDGFMDTCDGIAAGGSPQERWRVMADGRVGAFGVMGAVLLLLVKFAALTSLPFSFRTAALLLTPTLSRWAMTYGIFSQPYAKPEGLGKAFKEQATPLRVILAAVIALAAALIFARLRGLFVMAGVLLVTMALAVYLRRRLGGLTGDCYGAISEVAEAAVLVLFLV